MIDTATVRYSVILVTETGQQINITDAVDDLSWEENKGELATRLTLSLFNLTYEGRALAAYAKPNCTLCVLAEWNSGTGEVARARITEHKLETSGSARRLTLTAYDDLFLLQKSQDTRVIASGTSTRAALMEIMADWSIPVAEYRGPETTHAKTVYRGAYLSDIILELLDDAAKKGGGHCMLRMEKGGVLILPKGANEEIYHLDENDTEVTTETTSTGDMVTRVKVMGIENSEGIPPVEATLDGKTEFGIRQRIYTRSQEDSLQSAKKAAEEILKEEGEPTITFELKRPDIPTIRKGDRVHVRTSTRQGYFYVEGIQHDAANRTMTLQLNP